MSRESEPRVLIKRLPGNDLPLPSRATGGSSGLDVRACVTEPVELRPLQRVLIPTGFCLALPDGFEAQIRPRSGLALKKGLTMLNTPGTIDSDYRGEVGVIAINLGDSPVVIRRGDRIAQMVINEVASTRVVEVEDLPSTSRGSGGFGSSGSQ